MFFAHAYTHQSPSKITVRPSGLPSRKKKNVAIEHLPFIVPFIDDVLLNTI
jgi:hypothetical protein